MRKSLFNYSFYSHPEIGNFRVCHGTQQPETDKHITCAKIRRPSAFCGEKKSRVTELLWLG
jgi:hypothetical protein